MSRSCERLKWESTGQNSIDGIWGFMGSPKTNNKTSKPKLLTFVVLLLRRTRQRSKKISTSLIVWVALTTNRRGWGRPLPASPTDRHTTWFGGCTKPDGHNKTPINGGICYCLHYEHKLYLLRWIPRNLHSEYLCSLFNASCLFTGTVLIDCTHARIPESLILLWLIVCSLPYALALLISTVSCTALAPEYLSLKKYITIG